MCFPIPFKKGLGPNTFNRWVVLFSPSARSCRAFVELSHVSGVPRKWGYTVEALRAHFRLCLARANGEGHFFFPFFFFFLFFSFLGLAFLCTTPARRRRRLLPRDVGDVSPEFSLVRFLVDMCVCVYSYFFHTLGAFILCSEEKTASRVTYTGRIGIVIERGSREKATRYRI